ncbi:probable acyl-CoA dehydrogenase 6 [Folsomia candida]|uniref:probable acyl-CoA dehydrogenase 6 n=1 Tax=Folsomia candida TaxID=158441 RepID=UPI000B903351|nr:probable acyl-CoA dehydrogenase 6 [Folsomia candida]
MATLKTLQALRLMQNKLGFSGFRKLSTSKSLSAAYESPLPDSFYNEEQKQMQATLGKIIENDINPFVDEWEKQEIFPAHQVFKKLGNAGLLGIDKDPEYGGLGLDFKYLAAVLEELGTIKCGGVGMGISVQMSMTQQALARFGSEELKKQFLVPSIAGDYVACVGISEPIAGSDVGSITTTAKRQGDDLIINGQKMWITNSLQADWICLLVNTSDGNKYKNKSLVCVPMNLKGITKTKIHKIGNDSSDTGQLFFEDVRVPAKNIIGDEGAGFYYQMLQFQQERLAASVGGLKAMDIIISETIDYTRQRKAFGKAILDNQVVNFRLAELASEVESLRALTYAAIDCFVRGEDVTRLASMAKLKAGRLARIVGDSCLQYWGGMGYSRETSISRYYRDTRLLSIGAGADEVMLQILTGLLNISPRSSK